MTPDEQRPPDDGNGEPEGTEERPLPEDHADDDSGAAEDAAAPEADDAEPEEDAGAGEPEGGDDAPAYNVYRSGEEDAVGKRAAAETPKPRRGGERPEYKVYRSRPRLSDRLRRSGPQGLGGVDGPSGPGLRERLGGLRRGGGRSRGGRRWLRTLLIGAGVWLLISFIAFAISAQIQKGQLSDQAKEALEGGPELLAGQNILILGGDRRPDGDTSSPPRADTIMVMHASLTSFRKLSIPRDVQAEVPGFGAEKINSAFSASGQRNGDAALMIRTVSDFLGIDIHHLVIVDFEGFADFIDALGGVNIDVPQAKGRPKGKASVCGDVDGGKRQGGVSLKLRPGKITLESQKALAFARLRKNDCNPSEDDRDRAARQQLVLNGIKSRLTSPIRFPINFIKGPLIGWAAPKAFISDMGGATLPQLAIAAIIGGAGDENVLKPSTSIGGNLIIPGSECERAVRELTGSAPDRDPICSPG